MLSLEGCFLQAVRSPDGCCLGALGLTGRRLSVSDGASRVHVFAIEPDGCGEVANTASSPMAAVVAGAAVAGVAVAGAATALAHTLSGAANGETVEANLDARAKMVAERHARVELAAQAADMPGVLEVLTQDDIHWLLPAAYADAASHPQFYQFPPPKPTPK